MAAASTLSSEQRSALIAAKLRSVVGVRPGLEPPSTSLSPATLPGSAALVGDGEGFVLLDDAPERRLGPALAWARRAGVEQLDLFVEGDAAGAVARRALHFASPPRVWRTDGATVVPAVPAPVTLPMDPPAGSETLVAVLEAHGVEVVVEDGQVVGEVLGLEVARIEHDAETGDPRLEVGVGRYDREVVAMLHQGMSSAESLAAVVQIVRAHRTAGVEPHPLNRLVPERWLRASLIADPAPLGMRELRSIPSPVGRRGLRDVEAAAAAGLTDAGAPAVVVCSVGVDLDLVPAAADARDWWADRSAVPPGEVALVVVVPERDAHPITERLAAALRHPAEVVAFRDEWRR